jgi:class 3 adenylate cyclase
MVTVGVDSETLAPRASHGATTSRLGGSEYMGRVDTLFGSGYDIGVASLIDGKLALEFGELFGDDARASTVDAPTAPDATQKSSFFAKKVARKKGEPGYRRERAHLAMYHFVQHRVFTGVFLLLTFFALFAPDLDLLYGDKDSEVAVAATTTAIFGCFCLEMLLHSVAKPRYFPRWPFFIDFISLVSIVPDTYFFKVAMSNPDILVSARLSSFESFFKLATRSTRAFRLNRLFRIVKIVALVPRITGLFIRNKRNVDAQVNRMLAKKLERVFAVLDEDLDNKIDDESLALLLSRLKKGKGMQDKAQAPTAPSPSGTPSQNVAASPAMSVRSLKTAFSLRGHQRVVTSTPSATSLGNNTHSSPLSGSAAEVSPGDSAATVSGALVWQKSETDSRGGQDSRWTAPANPHHRSSVSSMQAETSVTLDVFKAKIMEDEWVYHKLREACEAELRNSHSVGNMASKHAEDVGMKVALAVLVMLLAVNLLSPTEVDMSSLQGLRYLDHQVVRKMGDGSMNATGPIPSEVKEHVQVWLQSSSEEQGLIVRYLDLNQYVFCSDFATQGGSLPCSGPASSPERRWSERGSLAQIDVDWGTWSAENRVEGRRDYLEVLTQPEAADDVSDQLSDEEFNARIRTVAVVSVKPDVQAKAVQLILTTLVVIFIIVLGIIFITMDLALMHRTLTDPLRALSFEMQSIKRMQLAGLDEHMEGHQSRDLRTEEIRVIQKIFENMKTAIKSWGKYVPWPVVQLLLQAGVDAEPNVAEKEVTLFFSDIAGFTGIVETMPPERSMVLLTKYFNDMSKVIDDHGGIVIEFIGDAIYAMYGAPLPDKGEHHTNAVKAAVGMLAQLDRINKWSVKQNPPLPEVGIRCGIHTGTCLVGNMGFASRIKYGVVGENANIPGRLEEMNKNYGTNNLMSAETYDRLDHTQFAIRPIDHVHLRQRDPPVSEPVYEVLGVGVHRKLRTAALQVVAQTHAEAMELYIDQRFSEAIPLFGEVNSKMQELTGCEADKPSVMLQARCKAYLLQPPEPDWDGVWNPDLERLLSL